VTFSRHKTLAPQHTVTLFNDKTIVTGESDIFKAKEHSRMTGVLCKRLKVVEGFQGA